VFGRATVPPWEQEREPPWDTREQPRYGGEQPDPPRIDADELAGLSQGSSSSTKAWKVQPLADEPSRVIARYLFATERFRGEWRRHLIHIVKPLGVALAATVLLGLGGGFAQATLDIGWLLPVTIAAWVVVMVWVSWRVADWHFDRFILTNKRVMVVNGIITRNVGMLPLARVTDMKYEQSPLGRTLNYGTFVIESAGQDQALREVPHLPNPNELYLRVVEEMYDPGAVEARVDQVQEDEERNPGGDA
jgi:membrane protein YdbS with pleckstrin-like domain